MEELDTKQTSTTPGSATTIRPRQFQCRWGSENSSVCDAFHLGQMTRFFTMRTKTVFLGSSLIDPDFNLDEDDDANDNMNTPERALSEPPSDITSIIASLKQFPDYQIDTGHTGCGVRRRLVPALDCIEKFVGDGRGLLGVFLRHGSPLSSISWTNRALPTAKTVDIRSSSINTIHYTNQSLRRSANSQEDQARLLFTARSRNWEA